MFTGLNFAIPQALARRNELYVTSLGEDSVFRYNADTGEFLGTFISSKGELDAPDGFAFGPDGNIYLSGYFSNNIVKYDGKTRESLGVFASGIDGPAELLFDREGNLLVNRFGTEQTRCNLVNRCSILKYDGKTGASLGVFASGNGLDGPDGLAFGPDNELYVTSFL
ncbi:MAG: hypothetical protein HC908_01950 [Calothrix sp. SM1_7_51]|nr:hypothetical protein [Calothrix sp. SM1_7_51]